MKSTPLSPLAPRRMHDSSASSLLHAPTPMLAQISNGTVTLGKSSSATVLKTTEQELRTVAESAQRRLKFLMSRMTELPRTASAATSQSAPLWSDEALGSLVAARVSTEIQNPSRLRWRVGVAGLGVGSITRRSTSEVARPTEPRSVSPERGQPYVCDMSGKPVVDQEKVAELFTLTDSDFFQSPTPEVLPLLEQRAERAQLEFLPSGSALLEDTALLPRGRHFSERANQNVSGYNFDTVNGELDDETIDLRTAMREVQPLKERPIPDAISVTDISALDTYELLDKAAASCGLPALPPLSSSARPSSPSASASLSSYAAQVSAIADWNSLLDWRQPLSDTEAYGILADESALVQISRAYTSIEQQANVAAVTASKSKTPNAELTPYGLWYQACSAFLEDSSCTMTAFDSISKGDQARAIQAVRQQPNFNSGRAVAPAQPPRAPAVSQSIASRMNLSDRVLLELRSIGLASNSNWPPPPPPMNQSGAPTASALSWCASSTVALASQYLAAAREDDEICAEARAALKALRQQRQELSQARKRLRPIVSKLAKCADAEKEKMEALGALEIAYSKRKKIAPAQLKKAVDRFDAAESQLMSLATSEDEVAESLE